MFDKIKKYFDWKIYTKKQIKEYCAKGIISVEQYKAITGEDYD